MIAKVSSVAVVGMEARPVEVEVQYGGGGLPEFHIVGLPSTAVREARQRVRSAIASAGMKVPAGRITANLAPGDLRKEGALLDLPLAVGVLAAAGKVDAQPFSNHLLVGELALDGRLRPVRGVLAAAMASRTLGKAGVIVPRANCREASLVPGIEVVGADHLSDALAFAAGQLPTQASAFDEVDLVETEKVADLAEVRGQALARRALEIAAAGGHNLLMVGPPGSGKTMLARRLPGILPPLTREESLEVTHVWSVAGLLEHGGPITKRPFRAPHHHASPAALLGGGSPYPRPGEVALAHRGVLFLDEFPLFSRAVLEALRQPLEDRNVVVARSGAAVRFPADLMLVAAANPCFCGKEGPACSCSAGKLEAYRARLSAPLLDRIDLQVECARLSEDELMELEPSESSTDVRDRVIKARTFRDGRIAEAHKPGTDAGVGALKELANDMTSSARSLLSQALNRGALTARGLSSVMRVARTVADLQASRLVEDPHVAEALHFRRSVWS